MTLIQIKHRFSDSVLFELECGSLKIAVEAAVKAVADLRGAYLAGADLGGADLAGADLRGAYLAGADLGGADLAGAYLGGAYLAGAYLRGADLRDANMDGRKVNGNFGLIVAGMPDNWAAHGFVDEETGELCALVGCQLKEIGDGRAYWSSPEHPERAKRREVLAALDYIEAVARLRGWPGAAKAEAA